MSALSPQSQTELHLKNATGRATWIERTDPRVRLVFSLAFACVVVSLNSLWVLSAALIGALLFLMSARLPKAETLKKVMAMDGFIVFLLIMLPFTTPGEEIFRLFDYPASREGFLLALEIMLTANAIVMTLLALVGTLEAPRLGHALERLCIPANLVHLLLFSVRYIDVLKQEYSRLRTAMKARCFQPRNSLHTYRSFGYLIGMLLVRSLERSERILEAMKCRGFQGKFYILGEMNFLPRDWILSIAGTVYLTFLLVGNFLHG